MEGKRVFWCFSLFEDSNGDIIDCSWIILRHSGLTIFVNAEKPTSKWIK